MMRTNTLMPPALPTQVEGRWDITCLRCTETTVTRHRNLSLALVQHSDHRCD